MRAFMLLAVAAFSSDLSAAALIEGERTSERVVYEDGTSVDVVCKKQGGCRIEIKLRGRNYVISETMLPAEIGIIPNSLVLTRSSGSSDNQHYTVSFETGCKEYAARPPAYACIATVSMNGEEVKSISVTKRVQIDEVVRRY